MVFRKIKKIFLILLGSFLIRLVSLNQSLWLDEAISANVAKNLGFLEIVKNFSINDFHPPLYYWILKLWIIFFGTSESSLRMPSIIFSLVTIYFVYLIGKKIKNEKTGIWAAILTATNPLFLYYSQETRMYSLVTMFLSVCLYFFIEIINNKKINKRKIILFNLFSFLSFCSFYGSIFLLLSFGIYLLIKKKNKLLFLTSIGTIISILVLSPLLKTQIYYSKLALIQVVNWKLVLGNVDLKNLLLFPLKFSIGRISFYPKKVYYLISGLWSIIVFWPVLKGIIKNRIIGFLFVTPLILGTIFSFFSPLMQYFRFLYLIPIMSLGIIYGIKKNFYKYFLTIGFLVFSLIYLINPVMHREDWKNLSKELKKTDTVYIIDSFSDPVKYYRNDIKIEDLKSDKISGKEITVIPYGEEIHGIDHNKKLEELGYKKTETKSFREVVLEKWLKTN